LVNNTFLAVNETTVLSFAENWVSSCVHVEVTHDRSDVKLREWENLGEFTVLQITLVEDDSLLHIDDVVGSVDQVTLLANSAPKQINEAFARLLWEDLRALVLLKDTHDVFNVKAAALVVQ